MYINVLNIYEHIYLDTLRAAVIELARVSQANSMNSTFALFMLFFKTSQPNSPHFSFVEFLIYCQSSIILESLVTVGIF